MAITHLQGTPVHTVGELPEVGTKVSNFTTTKADLSDLSLADFSGKTVLLNIYPSVDTGICAASVRRFNAEAAAHPDVVVVGISMDLPFALDRFCGAEGIDRVITTSAFRSDFGDDYGLKLAGSPMAGLLARAVIIIDAQGIVKYTELVPEIKQDPDFEAALAAL